MWKPITKVIDKLYGKYGTPMPIMRPTHKIIIDETQLNHYKVCEDYNYIDYTHICDDPCFEEYIKDRLVDKLADAIQVTKKGDIYKDGYVTYEAEIWTR